jgi:hypothetical protein
MLLYIVCTPMDIQIFGGFGFGTLSMPMDIFMGGAG